MRAAAAKAAGIEALYPFGRGEIYVRFDGLWAHRDTSDGQGALKVWNPLADNDQAFRLAVKMDLIPHYMRYSDMHGRVYDEAGKLAATRLAIVRAAAAMAEESPA